MLLEQFQVGVVGTLAAKTNERRRTKAEEAISDPCSAVTRRNRTR